MIKKQIKGGCGLKKFFISFIFFMLAFNIGLASPTKIPSDKRKQFKVDMSEVLNDVVYTNKINGKTYEASILEMYDNNYKLYQNFLINKNNMKQNKIYVDKMNQSIGGLCYFYDYFYNDFVPIIQKYSLQVDDEEDYFNYIMTYYLKKYKINNTNEFLTLYEMIPTYRKKISIFRDEIENYSKLYEQTKAENFHKNVVNKKNVVEDLDNKLLNIRINNEKQYNFSKNKIYVSKAKIFQILDGAILANDAYNTAVLYIQTNSANSLHYNDQFIPYIPLKYIGISQYKTIFGETKTMIKFREVLPNEFKQNAKLPQIQEPFYFIKKPSWENILEYIVIVNSFTYTKHIFRKGYR